MKSTLSTIQVVVAAAACCLFCTEGTSPMTESPHPQFEHTEVQPAHLGNDHMSEGVLLPLSDGRIMLAFRRDPGVEGHHVGTGGHIAQSIYDPAADRWSEIETIYSSDGRFDDRNIHGGVTRDGKLVLFMRRMRGNKQTEKRYLLVSEDDGQTWSDLLESEAWSDPEASDIPGIWSTGQMFYNPDIEQYMMLGCRRYVTFSPDGVTWDKVVKMTDSEQYKLTEVAGAWCGDNRVVALIRDNEHARGHPLLQLASRDNGETWSDPEPSNIPPDNHWGCAPQLFYDAERELLIAMTSTRYTKPNREQALYVYTARPAEIIDNPEGWTLQLEIPRPWADASIRDQRPLNHTFYGYPTIAPVSDDEYLVVFTERARMQGTEQADLYYFRMRVDSGGQHAPDGRGAVGQRYLFFDDHVIDKKDNLTRTLHRPEKQGAVLTPDQWWEKGLVYAFSPPIYVPEEDVYKWVYRPYYKNYSALAVSEDGVHWEKPELGVYEFEGRKDHSIFSDRRILQVVEHPDPPDPSRRYMALAEKTPVASPDLVHWEEVGAADLPGGDSGTLTYDEKADRFLAPVKVSGNHRYRQFDWVESKDFSNWTEARPFMVPDERDQELAVERIRRWLSSPNRPKPLFVEPSRQSGWAPPEDIRKLPKRDSSWNAQIYNVGVFPYHGYYVAILAMYYPTGVWLPDHKNTAGFSMIELAVSRDMEQWTRLREPFIEPATLDEGVVNNYERMLVYPTSRPVVRGDELLFYYGGSKAHMSAEKRYSTWSDGTARDEDTLTDLEQADREAGASAVYLATLRRDGFVSLDAGDTPGRLLTKAIEAEGDSLYINLACGDEGYAVVELLGTDGEVAGASPQLTGDQVKMPVHWEKGEAPDIQEGLAYKVRITLRGARLYALWFE